MLAHLDQVGFCGTPRFLGLDAKGREVLTFVAGEVAARPWPAWVADEQRIASVARLVRSYDDAVATLPIPDSSTGVQFAAPLGMPASIAGPAELLGHMDVTPENVVFRNSVAVALIDFDLVRPATRTEEVGNVLLWWAPLMPIKDRELVLRDVDQPQGTRRRRVIGRGSRAAADTMPACRQCPFWTPWKPIDSSFGIAEWTRPPSIASCGLSEIHVCRRIRVSSKSCFSR